MSKEYEKFPQKRKDSRNQIIPYFILLMLLAILVVYFKSDGSLLKKTEKQQEKVYYDFGFLEDITYPVLGFLNSQKISSNIYDKILDLLMENTPLYRYSIESSSKEYGLLMQEQLLSCEDKDFIEFCAENTGEDITENMGNCINERNDVNAENDLSTGNEANAENDLSTGNEAHNETNAENKMNTENAINTENNVDTNFLIQNVIFENIGMDSTQDMAAASSDVKSDTFLPVSAVMNTANNSLYFTPAIQKVQEYSAEQLSDQNFLLKTFYAVDSGTTAPFDKLEIQKLMSKDMRIDKSTAGPQILIYHTHSQEGFADSVAGDDSTTIIGAGEELARILEADYGYKVLHHVGEYDTKEHDYAYSYALPEITKILENNPSIQVVIDLHRDEMKEGKKLLTEQNGKQMAQIMFFNGLSYVNSTGAISYLENKNLSANLAFSFQMQKAANEYYPGFARKIYLKGYRYNMHLAEKYLLIELGAQTNTVEEIKNACYPLADILDKVIGE